jgi:hypothetical protein
MKKNTECTPTHMQLLMQKLHRELHDCIVLISPTCPDGSIIARLYSRVEGRVVTLPFDLQAIKNDKYLDERISTARSRLRKSVGPA